MLADRIKATLKVNANSVSLQSRSSVLWHSWEGCHSLQLMTITRLECLLILSKPSNQFSFKLTSTHTYTNPKPLAVRAHRANVLADITSNKHTGIHTHTHTQGQTHTDTLRDPDMWHFLWNEGVISAVLWARAKGQTVFRVKELKRERRRDLTHRRNKVGSGGINSWHHCSRKNCWQSGNAVNNTSRVGWEQRAYKWAAGDHTGTSWRPSQTLCIAIVGASSFFRIMDIPIQFPWHRRVFPTRLSDLSMAEPISDWPFFWPLSWSFPWMRPSIMRWFSWPDNGHSEVKWNTVKCLLRLSSRYLHTSFTDRCACEYWSRQLCCLCRCGLRRTAMSSTWMWSTSRLTNSRSAWVTNLSQFMPNTRTDRWEHLQGAARWPWSSLQHISDVATVSTGRPRLCVPGVSEEIQTPSWCD